MRVAITGATGLIGETLAKRLLARGDQVTLLARNPVKARTALPDAAATVKWTPDAGEIAPSDALSGCDGVVHLIGEPIAQRWTEERKRRMWDSRVASTRLLVEGLKAASPRPSVLACASAVGYYGPHGPEELDETDPPGADFLSQLCVEWEHAAQGAEELGLRVVRLRNGIALDARDGALKKMLIPFRLGIGGPVASGDQYMPWIHIDDLTKLYIAALDSSQYMGAVNATSPNPVTNREFSKTLGRVLRRPAVVPVPGLALRILYGEMGSVVTEGQRALPAKALAQGFRFGYDQIEEALRSVLDR